MAHRVDVVLDDEVWERLRSIPRGDRSRFVSDAVRQAAQRRRRRAAVADLEALAPTLREPAGTAEDWIRAHRDGR